MVDISAEQLKIISEILTQYVPKNDVWAFGSRITGAAQPFSDLDLVIIAAQKLPRETLSALQEAFIASDIPFRVDVLDWGRLSPEFQRIIAAQYVALQTANEMNVDEPG